MTEPDPTVKGRDGSELMPFLVTTSVYVPPTGRSTTMELVVAVAESLKSAPAPSFPVTTNVHRVSVVPAGKAMDLVGVESISMIRFQPMV